MKYLSAAIIIGLLLLALAHGVAAQTPRFEFALGDVVTAPGHRVTVPLSVTGVANLAEAWQVDLLLSGDGVDTLALGDAEKGPAVPDGWIFASHASASEPVVRTIAVSATSEPALLEGELARIPVTVPELPGDQTSVITLGPMGSERLPGGVEVVGDGAVMFERVSVAPGAITVARCGNLTYQEDGLVTIQDLALLLQTLVGLREPAPGYYLLADVTRDSQVNVLDAIRLLQHLSGVEGRFIAAGACGPEAE